MGRSTFEGPILSGDNRFGPQRDVGYALLTQSCFLDFSVTTPGTAGYSGASTIYVSPNNIPNNIATLYAPQAGVTAGGVASYSQTGPTVATVTGDSVTTGVGSTINRGVVFTLPAFSTIQSIDFDYIATPTAGATTASSVSVFIHNQFISSSTGAVYASIAANNASTVGRTAATFTATQYANCLATLQDVQKIKPGQQPTYFSQVVANIQMLGLGLTAPTSGKFNIFVRYIQTDQNIGNSSTYPYGNFD